MKILHFIRLLRPINLAVIVLTMYVLRYFLLANLLAVKGFELRGADFEFGMLILATVLIAGAGNIINDYFDLRTDRINKPHRLIVGRHIKRRIAMAAHFLMTVIALLIGTWISWHMRSFSIIFFFLLAISVLWSYSARFKRQLIIGNVLIAVLSGIIPLLVGFFELPGQMLRLGSDPRELFTALERKPSEIDLMFLGAWIWILVYAGFAFLSTLVREIQKDIADVKGDRAMKATTIPIFFGIERTRYIVMILILIMISILISFQKTFIPDPFSFWYVLIGVAVPMILSGIITMRSTKRSNHLLASNFIKLSMAVAVCYTVFM